MSQLSRFVYTRNERVKSTALQSGELWSLIRFAASAKKDISTFGAGGSGKS